MVLCDALAVQSQCLRFHILRLFWDLKNALGSQKMLRDLKNVLDKIVDVADIVDTVGIIEIVHAVVMGGNVDVVDIG